jgi:geranylgeranyl diphosphate synthase type II
MEPAARARFLLAEAYANGMGPLDGVEPRLAAVLSDLLSRQGSLTRAVVAFRIGVEMGLEEDMACGVACGIEYLHTASLVFDDLPAMDDARTRRGGPCVHVVHGEGPSMLAALALVNRGYSLLWNAVRVCAPGDHGARAAALIEECLGTLGLVGGQAHDLRGWRDGQTSAEVTEVALRKTAALVRLPVVLPALLGGAGDREISLLERLALLRGLAYQAADDLKDVLHGEEQSGKSAGRDQAMGRPNLVTAEGLPGAMARFRRLGRMADRVEAMLPGPGERWTMLEILRVDEPVGLRMMASGE